MKSKKFLIPALILLVVSFLSFFSGFVMIYLCRDQIFGIISMFTTGVVCLILCIIFFEKYRKEEKLEPLPHKEEKPIITKKKSSSYRNEYSHIEEQDDEDDLDEEEWLDSLEEDELCPNDDDEEDEIMEDEGDDFDELNVLK